MSCAIQLIVGLANPGKEYADTRHNAGAWFIHALAENEHAALRSEAKFHGLVSKIVVPTHELDHTCHLLIPTTFMNRSGQAVRACMNFYKIPPEGLLVVHDDLDLPVGAIKLKYDGGDGGHNGLKDIIQHLNTKQFYRLRIGVGRPRYDVVDYVLNAPSKADKKEIDHAIHEALTTLPLMLQGDMQRAMQKLHTRD